jgi:hypothetical protein
MEPDIVVAVLIVNLQTPSGEPTEIVGFSD